jgi:predicted DCC family thiol-disulfide oxidoreductase YuxK
MTMHSRVCTYVTLMQTLYNHTKGQTVRAQAMVTAIFDGRCVLCQTTRALINRLDWLRRVEFLDLHQQHEVLARFPQLENRDLLGSIHVIDDENHVYNGFPAMRRMLKEVPLGFPFWVMFHMPGLRRLGPIAYRWIAQNRYAINKMLGVDLPDTCEDGICKMP